MKKSLLFRRSMFSNLRNILIAIVAIAVLIAALPATAALLNQRTDLRVLLLSADNTEPTTAAWEATFNQEGVPYDKIVLRPSHVPLTAATFADTLPGNIPHAKYEAVVIATGGLLYNNGGAFVSALDANEWAALNSFEATYGIRQITAYTFPTPDYGLNYPSTGRELGGTTTQLTANGLVTFPYLKGPVFIDVGTWSYLTTPLNATNFNTLLTGPNSSSLLGIYTHPENGREEMVVTFDQNAFQLHSRLLRHGMLSWATRGVFIGYNRNYFALHVDDVFLDDERWNPATHANSTTSSIRMTAADVTRAVTWSNDNNVILTLVFNGSGSVDAGGASDPLTVALLAAKDQFRWINHTYNHTIFDDIDDDPTNGLQPADLATIESEISLNVQFAVANALDIDDRELVTGGHSGLFNVNMPQALRDTGIRWIADDNSRRPNQWLVGPALTVPRYPTNVYYNTSTKAEQLDEYNYLYLPPALGGVCVNTSVTTCFTARATWDTYVAREGTTMLNHALSNDPKPHYMHQSNLAGDGVLYLVTNNFLTQYRKYMKPALVNPEFRSSGNFIQRADNWTKARNASLVQGYVQNGVVTLQSKATTATNVPVTGVLAGALYGTQRSLWQSVPANGTISLPVAP